MGVIFITHDMGVVADIADRVLVMYRGEAVETGSVEEIFRRPAHPYTRSLLAAVPRLDAASRTTDGLTRGDMPSPLNPPSGCHFHPRCSEAAERCRTDYPEERWISETRVVRCHLVN